MRSMPVELVEAFTTGSVPSARLVVNAWYDGRLAYAGVPVEKWSVSWDGADSAVVQGKLSLTVADADGSLSPWAWDEALSAGGSRLQCSVVMGDGDGAVAGDLGWFLIDGNQPNETWRVSGRTLRWVPGGASLPVTGEEVARLAADYRFWSPEAPPSGATLKSEVARLLREVCPVVFTADVVDRPVPSGMVYEKTRGEHAHDLIRSYGYHHRMTGAGALEVYSQARTDPVWTIRGRAGEALVTVARRQSRGDILNGVASTSNDTSLEIRRLATVSEGPLRYGGPAGWLIQEHTALVNTAEGVQADAETYLASKVYAKTVPLMVRCLPHPGIQVGDWVRVAHPVIDGSEYPVDGVVTSAALSGSASGFDDMALTVEISAADAQAVGLHVRRSR